MSHSKTSTPPRSAGDPIFVVEPQAPHTHTLILLHGLGSNGEKFGTELLDTGVTSSGCKLTELLPGARFVFPTSKRRRSSTFRRSMLTQWFDIARLPDPSYRKEIQLDGLAESAVEILAILDDELKRVPAQNIILGGLSQGCSMSLAVLLSLEHPIGGYIGMSGYLTYQSDLEIAVAEDDFTDDPFSNDDDPAQQDPSVKAQTFERDLLSLSYLEEPTKERTSRLTPVFLGHGSIDEKVPCALGEAAAQVMRDSGYQVDWKCYENQGHWYKIPEEIDDVVNFIVSRVGWEVGAIKQSN
ncbi:acyl-protein thioesterase [Ilyonectria sp. MPI-CAGE-AT-0026]|nr:acyl-protein thioesterase [Ilyonectria sp. MPI-CAGE-AT-0026]